MWSRYTCLTRALGLEIWSHLMSRYWLNRAETHVSRRARETSVSESHVSTAQECGRSVTRRARRDERLDARGRRASRSVACRPRKNSDEFSSNEVRSDDFSSNDSIYFHTLLTLALSRHKTKSCGPRTSPGKTSRPRGRDGIFIDSAAMMAIVAINDG